MKIKSYLKKVLKKFGLEIFRISKNADDKYNKIFPLATYSPWNIDFEFKNIYNNIKNYTLVDKYRCYELWKLIEQSSKLKEGVIIEIGVWRGGTGALIAKQAINRNIKDTVYLCDTFSGVVKASIEDSYYKGGEHSDTSENIVKNLIHSLNLHNVKILLGIFPEQTSKLITEKKIRFCHIDVDVYQSAKDINNWIWEKLVHGGIVVYDDYGFYGCNGVSKYVEEQMDKNDRIIIHNLNGHAIVIKL